MNWGYVSGGFRDPVPAPLASGRHVRRLLYITIGIAIAMFLQARNASPTPIASRVPLYFMLIAVELVLAWFVTIGVKARGYRLVDIVDRPGAIWSMQPLMSPWPPAPRRCSGAPALCSTIF
jgi:hypothetical protein